MTYGRPVACEPNLSLTGAAFRPFMSQMLRESDTELRRASETLKRGELTLDPVVHK